MLMDINIFRGLITVVLLFAFIALVFWVYRPENKQKFKHISEQLIDDDLTIDQPVYEGKVNE